VTWSWPTTASNDQPVTPLVAIKSRRVNLVGQVPEGTTTQGESSALLQHRFIPRGNIAAKHRGHPRAERHPSFRPESDCSAHLYGVHSVDGVST
jgi:hypothetical protein